MPDLNEQALPCPFCGGKDISQAETDGPKWGAMVCSCGAIGPEVRTGYRTEEVWRPAALAEWNRRALPASPPDARDKRCDDLHPFGGCDCRPSAEAGELVALARRFCDVVTDSKGRESFEFDNHGIVAFARALLAPPRPAQAEGSGDKKAEAYRVAWEAGYAAGRPATPQAEPPRVTRRDVDLLCGELHVGESEECRCQHCTDIKRILAAVEYVAALSRHGEGTNNA